MRTRASSSDAWDPQHPSIVLGRADLSRALRAAGGRGWAVADGSGSAVRAIGHGLLLGVVAIVTSVVGLFALISIALQLEAGSGGP